MRKIIPFAVLLGLVVFAVPAYAPPPSREVVVVNEPTVHVGTMPVVEPVQLHHFEQFSCGECDIWHRFPIELDKTLLVEHISIACSPSGTLGAMAVGRTTVSGRTYAALWLTFEETGLVRYRDHAYATHAVTYYVHGGDELEFRIMADDTEEGVCTIGIVGRYVDGAP